MKTPQQMLDEKATQVWETFKRAYPTIGECPKMVLSRRLRVTAGYCWQEPREVHIRASLFPEFTRLVLLTIIPHELAHQVDFDLHGDCADTRANGGHGPTWSNIMLNYGLTPCRYLPSDIRPTK